jgi:hypothetical protein
VARDGTRSQLSQPKWEVMNTVQLQPQLEDTRAIACRWGPAWLYDATAKSPQHKEPSALTVDLAATTEPSDASLIPCQADGGGNNQLAAPAEFTAYSESCWSEVFPDVYRFLTGPRSYPSPCPWCGGRLVHNHLCDDLRASLLPKMPFGKHKGKPLNAVPVDYLKWIASTDRFGAELREAIRDYLQSARKPSDQAVLDWATT